MDGLRARRGASQLSNLDINKAGEITRASSAGALVVKEKKDVQQTQKPTLSTRSFSLTGLYRKVQPADATDDGTPGDAKSSTNVCTTHDAQSESSGPKSSKPNLHTEDEDKLPLKLPEVLSPASHSCTSSSLKRSMMSGLSATATTLSPTDGSDTLMAFSKTLSSETSGSRTFGRRVSENSTGTKGTISRSIDFLRGAFSRSKHTGEAEAPGNKRKVMFNLDKTEERCVTPYSLKYGRPLRSFVFSRSGMVESVEERKKSKEKAVGDLVAAATRPILKS